MTPREDFLTRLMGLAKVCNFALDKTIVAIYEKALAPFDLSKVSRSIEHIIVNRKTRDPFPSVKEIIEIMSPQLNDDNEAVEAGSRIVQAVSRFGYSNPGDAHNFIGDLGWRIVERFGGWGSICQSMTPDNTSFMLSQFVKLGKAQIQRAKIGLDGVAPVIPISNQKRESDLLPAGKIFPQIEFNPEDEPPRGA